MQQIVRKGGGGGARKSSTNKASTKGGPGNVRMYISRQQRNSCGHRRTGSHMRADCKSIPSHITLLSFLLRKRRVAVRRKKKTFATFPGKRQFHSSRSQAPSARGGKGAPTTTTSSFQLSPQRNSRTTNPSPPFPPLPHFSRWMTSRPHHHQHFISRRRRPGFPIEFRK